MNVDGADLLHAARQEGISGGAEDDDHEQNQVFTKRHCAVLEAYFLNIYLPTLLAQGPAMQFAGLAEKLKLGAHKLKLALQQQNLTVGNIGAGQLLVAGIGVALLDLQLYVIDVGLGDFELQARDEGLGLQLAKGVLGADGVFCHLDRVRSGHRLRRCSASASAAAATAFCARSKMGTRKFMPKL